MPPQAGPTNSLYKYFTRAKYARQMVKHGTVQVGTLAYYRGQEQVDELRGDALEGIVEVHEHHPGEVTVADLSPELRPRFEKAQDTVFIDSTFGWRSLVPDAYVYCVSRELSRRAAGRAVACVEIFDPTAFLRAIHAAVRQAPLHVSPSILCNHGPIQYRPRVVTHHDVRSTHPAFIKPERFRVENEWRFLWPADTTSTHGRPAIVSLFGSNRFAREVQIPD